MGLEGLFYGIFNEYLIFGIVVNVSLDYKIVVV